jgi:Zn-dependent protease with chaperone function
MTFMGVGERAISAPVGLYGHVRANNVRSLVLFAGFLIAFHLMAAAILTPNLLIFDWRHAPFVGRGGYTLRYMLPVTLFGALLFAVAYWWHVSAVRKDTGFHYVDDNDEPRLCRIIEPLITLAGIRTPFVGVIESPALNAFACGVRDSHMVVVVTRGLIDSLDDEELEAVLAHELIHIRNRDTRLMAAANAFIGNLTWLRRRGGRADLNNLRAGIGLCLLPIFLPLALTVSFVTQLAFRIGYCSRAIIGSSREFIADAEAVRLTQNPAAMISALRKVDGHDEIAGMSESHDAMLIAGAVEGPAATHPTIAQRIAALIQVTGPMAGYAPMRRDTRTPEQRRTSGFGRALGTDMTQMVATAERPTIWEILRHTRDPERNILGLNRKGMFVVASALACALLVYGPLALTARKGSPMRSVNAANLQELGDIANETLKCQMRGLSILLGNPTGDKFCSVAEAKMGEFSKKNGIPYESQADQEAKRQRILDNQLRNRCFSHSYHNWPAPYPMALDQSGSDDVEQMDWYRRVFAERDMAWLNWPAGPARDKELGDYVSMRALLIDHVYYYFGQRGLDQFNAWGEAPEHRAALTLFLQRSRDAAFVEKFKTDRGGNDFEAAQLIATYPDEAVPCASLRAEGKFQELPGS